MIGKQVLAFGKSEKSEFINIGIFAVSSGGRKGRRHIGRFTPDRERSHVCLSQTWQRAFARFLILPGELHLGGPKPNCHNPGLGAPILYKLTSWGQEYKFLLRNPRVLLALVQTLLTCLFHLKSLVIVTHGIIYNDSLYITDLYISAYNILVCETIVDQDQQRL